MQYIFFSFFLIYPLLIDAIHLNGDGVVGWVMKLRYIILSCNNTRPIYTPGHISDVQYSCFLCCTKFLFPVLYKTPVFSDVECSCFLCCTKFLFSLLYKIPAFNDVQYSCMRCCTLVCFALICRIKVWMYIILVGVLYLILMYTSIATHRSVHCSPVEVELEMRICAQ